GDVRVDPEVADRIANGFGNVDKRSGHVLSSPSVVSRTYASACGPAIRFLRPNCMRFGVLRTLHDPARRRRAFDASLSFEDPEFPAAAERVFLFIERVSGVPPAEVDLESDIGLLMVGHEPCDSLWDRLADVLGLDTPRRVHAFENLRTGSVRHLIQHLCICRVCRRTIPGPDRGH